MHKRGQSIHMTTKFIPAKHNVEIETRKPSPNLLECAVAVLRAADQTRDAVAAIVRSYDYTAHVGGCHVAIIDGETRLAIITSNTPDFN